MTIHADARIRAGLFDGDERAELALDPQRIAYVHAGARRAARQRPAAAGRRRRCGSTASRRSCSTTAHDAEVLVFDLAPDGPTLPFPLRSLTRNLEGATR